MKHSLLVLVLTILPLVGTQSASAATSYADWTLTSGNGGSGTFNGVGVPNFTFTIVGQHDPASTEIDGNDIFDNVAWEAMFGEGDNQESLRFGNSPLPTLTTSTVTIVFASPVNPSSLAFAVTDLEGEDAVISASLGGSAVGSASIGTWLQGLFDSQPATAASPHLPSAFDIPNSAVVAEFDADGLLSTEILAPSGTESASAWFIPNTAIDTLVISHRNRFGDTASMHVYMASTDATSATAATNVPTLGTMGLILLSFMLLGFGVTRLSRKPG